MYGNHFCRQPALSTEIVERYIPPNAFNIVQQVHLNLGLLNELVKHLPTYQAVNSKLYELNGIERYLGDIVAVANNLNNIVTVHNELPILQDLAPRIKEYTSKLKCVESKLDYFNLNSKQQLEDLTTKIKYIEDLYIQYECGLQTIVEEQLSRLTTTANGYLQEFEYHKNRIEESLSDFDTYLPLMRRAADNQDKIEAKLAHLEASDAVTLWVFSQDDDDYKQALKAIKHSEEYENDESMNRKRLKYEQQHDVLRLIKNSSEPQIDKECNGGCNV